MKEQTLVKHHPKNLYDFPEKDGYRETIWGTFAKELNPSTAKILFFPGKQGLEIEVALGYGFKEESLIACDRSKALIATAQWHKQYPQIRCYGSELSRTIDRLAEDDIIIDGINLDYCSNLCGEVLDDLIKVLNYIVKKKNHNLLLAITLLKGRESSALTAIAKLVFKEASGAVDRVSLVRSFLMASGFYTMTILNSDYRSNTKNMSYGVLSIQSESSVQSWWGKPSANAIAHRLAAEKFDEAIPSAVIKLKEELNQTQQKLVKAESEKIQLLQTGYAYR